ncbi:hypothetical protein NQZ68_014015 [Dissostichus eleginoides]|nr:hypothetical protein NQZ68_014015 [Dissostichus eleginoides]
MENHVLLWRKRPADWQTAGAQRASCTSNREMERGLEEGEAARRNEEKKNHQQAKRRRIHLSSPLLQKLSHLRFHILPFLRALRSLPPPTAVLSSPHSLPTPMEVDRVVRSMTTRLAILAEALRRMGGHGRAPVADSLRNGRVMFD